MNSIAQKVLCLLLLFAPSLDSQEEETSPPTVLVIGHGFMGANHVKNLEILQKEGLVKIIGVADIDETRLKNLPYPCFRDGIGACRQLSPDIVVIASSTATHYELAQGILNASSNGKAPALFIEKPLVETSLQAAALASSLKKAGYPDDRAIACGYLFRQSPVVEEAIQWIKLNALTVEGIQVRWQKKRAATRPSAGVHIDEATHPLDLILNQLFPALDLPHGPLALTCHTRKYDDAVIDKEQQLMLYWGQPEKLIPLAQVEFQLHTPQLDIDVFSSFSQPPQIREILIKCSSHTEIRLSFDKDQNDQLEIFSPLKETSLMVFEKPNKLLIEWRNFLDYYHSGKPSRSIASIKDMVEDIQITEMLDLVPLHQKSPVPVLP